MKNLNDLWILTNTGALIFQKNEKSVADEQFFAMLLSVINNFAEQLSTGGLSSFELGAKRFSMSQQNDFIFIGSAPIKIKVKYAKRELHDVINLFFNIYPENIADTWNGDLKRFSDFGNEIDKKFK